MLSKIKCSKCKHEKNDKRKAPCCWCRVDRKNTHFIEKPLICSRCGIETNLLFNKEEICNKCLG